MDQITPTGSSRATVPPLEDVCQSGDCVLVWGVLVQIAAPPVSPFKASEIRR